MSAGLDHMQSANALRRAKDGQTVKLPDKTRLTYSHERGGWNASPKPPTASADTLAIEQLQEAYAMSSYAGCSLFACEGSATNRIVGMQTCRNCATHIMLRRALKRMGILPTER